MKGRRSIKLAQWLAIIVTSLFAGVLISVYDYFLIRTPVVDRIAIEYSFGVALAFNMVNSLVAGTLQGAFMVYYIQERYQDKPYGYTLIALLLIFTVLFTAVSLMAVVGFIVFIRGISFSDPNFGKVFYELFFHRVNPVVFVWIPLVALQQLMLQIFSKFGPGLFWKIVRGKYYTPKNENRIFMFADLNSSTSIAEKLGNERYYYFLKDFFADITASILDHGGEIYQYLGDGIIIAWQAHGDARDAQCINCFFDMKKEIAGRKEKYLQRYGLIPGFKAGLHYGRVIVGEIGIIKRDISYSGDVMNTTARIQGMCHELNREILVSNDLLGSIAPSAYFSAIAVGAIKLKGKEKEVGLSSVELV